MEIERDKIRAPVSLLFVQPCRFSLRSNCYRMSAVKRNSVLGVAEHMVTSPGSAEPPAPMLEQHVQ